jgi:hypothetical protein
MPLDNTCRTLKSTVVAASVALLFVVGAGTAFSAGPPPPPAGEQGGQKGGPRGGMMDPQRVEERLVSLKADLKITEAQTPAWNNFADAMRANAKAMQSAATDMRPAEGSAPDALKRMEAMDAMAKVHAQGSERLLNAFRPLYAQLNDDQRKVAAEKLAPPPPPRG